jgi:hypothetical protein
MDSFDQLLAGLDYSNAPFLTEREMEILNHLLTADLPDAGVLRQQAASARLLHTCSCGCATVALLTDPDVGAAGDLPIAAVRSAGRGLRAPELILRIEHGRLASIEIDGDGELHETFPSPERFEPPMAVVAR